MQQAPDTSYFRCTRPLLCVLLEAITPVSVSLRRGSFSLPRVWFRQRRENSWRACGQTRPAYTLTAAITAQHSYSRLGPCRQRVIQPGPTRTNSNADSLQVCLQQAAAAISD